MKIKLNEDKEIVKEIQQKLKLDKHCPCKIQKIPDNICMCKEFREQKESGYCHCGLYYKEIEG